MIGAKSFTIGADDFILGMTSSDYTSDGGFSNRTTGINPIAVQGVLNAPGTVTDKSANLVGEMICSCEDPTQNASRLFLARNSSNEDGTFYYMASDGTLTLKRTDSANNYIFGKSDMIGFQTAVYATSQGAITEWIPDSGFNTSFFSFSDALAPHPALVYENNAFYGDGNLLLRQTIAGATPTTILTLAANQVITALGIDSGTGKMLISVVDQYNNSDTINSQARVLYYDGFSQKALKVVLVDNMITAFYVVENTIYVTYGQRLGYWTGSGIQFLRKLDLAFDNTILCYKHHLTNIGNILYLVEKTQILAFGEITGSTGGAFWYALKNTVGDEGNYSLVTNIGSNKLGLGLATTKFYTFDTMSVSSVVTGGTTFYTRRYYFDRPVIFNSIVLTSTAAFPTTTQNLGTVAVLDSTGTTTVIKTIGNTTGVPLTVPTEQECPWASIKTRSLQFRLTIAPETLSNVFPIQRFTVFYNQED